MSEVVITLKDDGEGSVDMSWDFDPPINKDSVADTPAQIVAATMMNAARKLMTGEDDD